MPRLHRGLSPFQTDNPQNLSLVDSCLAFSFLPALKTSQTQLVVFKLELAVQWWSSSSILLKES